MPTMQDLVNEVNRLSAGRPFGNLQALRKQVKPISRPKTLLPFGPTASEDWAFHSGGREEIQFNLGREAGLSGGDLRYGLAFSFEPSRALTDVSVLYPKVARFNDLLRGDPTALGDVSMWHYRQAGKVQTREGPYEPRAITPDVARPRTFVFVGRLCSWATPDYEAILTLFDRLLEVWRAVEVGGVVPVNETETEPPTGGAVPPPAVTTTAARKALLIDVQLLHNELQRRLFAELQREFDDSCIGLEFPAKGGGRVDAIVQTPTDRILFEIKTARTARGCIREALGQLLDYGRWPGRIPATQLVVVGSPAPTAESEAYLRELSRMLPLAISYRQVALELSD